MSDVEAYHELVAVCDSISTSVGPAEMIPHYETGRLSLTFKASLRFDWSLLDESAALREMGVLGTELLGDWLDSLQRWADLWELEPEVEVLVSLCEAYPAVPPEIRLLRPVLESGSGGVINGFLMGVPSLFPAGWAPTTLAAALQAVREALAMHGARAALPSIPSSAPSLYSVQAYSATRTRAHMDTESSRAAFAHRSTAEIDFYFFSSAYATRFLAAEIPPGFDAGGKMLLPMAALERVMRVELSEGLPPVRSVGGGGGASSSVSATVKSLLAVADADATTSESAMVFGIDSPLGFSAFAGVREFTSPEPDIAIVPPEMLANLGVPEGSKLRVWRASLPQGTGVVLQPHSCAFHDVEASTGVAPREFLEESFSKFATLAPGETILCDGGLGDYGGDLENGGGSACDVVTSENNTNTNTNTNHINGGTSGDIHLRIISPKSAFRFTVIGVEPFGMAACALFSGFASSVNIEFLPAQDDEAVIAAAPHAGRGGASGDRTSSSSSSSNAAAAAAIPRFTPELAASFDDESLGALPGVAVAPSAGAGATIATTVTTARSSRGITNRQIAVDAAANLLAPLSLAGGAGRTITPLSTPRGGVISGGFPPRTAAAASTTTAAVQSTAAAMPTAAERRVLAAEAAMKRAAAAIASREESN